MGALLLALIRFILVDLGGVVRRSQKDDSHRVEINFEPNQTLVVDGAQVRLEQVSYPPWNQSLDSVKRKGFSTWAEVDLADVPLPTGREWAVISEKRPDRFEFTATPTKSIALGINGDTPVASEPQVWKFDLLQVRRIPFTVKTPKLAPGKLTATNTSIQSATAIVVRSDNTDASTYEFKVNLMIDWKRLKVTEEDEVYVTPGLGILQRVNPSLDLVNVERSFYSSSSNMALALIIVQRRIPFEVQGALREVPMTRK